MKKSILSFTGILLLVLIQFTLKAQRLEDAVGLSHKGDYVAAEKIFSSLIKADSDNVPLLVLSGFNNAWNKDYESARERFLKALQLQPTNADAAKGLAYTYLYQGSFIKAATHFEKLSQGNSNSEELHIAAGLSYMNLQKAGKALKHFEQVLRINNANAEAKKYIAVIKDGKGIAEISVLAGFSSYGDEHKSGLRQLQAGYHFNSQNFVYARFDNALSLDNYFLQKNNYSSSAFIGGVYSRWHQYIGSKFEYGYRSLPQNIRQNIYQTEQVIFLPKKMVVKLGGSFISSSGLKNEWMLMSGVSVALSQKIKIEPQYYFIQRLAGEHRLQLNAVLNLTPNTDVALGVFAGKEKNVKLNINNRVSGIFAYSNFYIKGPLAGTVLARYEKDASARNSLTAAAGIKLRIHTKKSN